MDIQLPSTRELELEMLLREREGQVVQLSDEVSRLRLYLSSQPPPSTAEPVTLPPTFASLLLPHIPHLPHVSAPAGSLNHNTTTAALTQRVKVLQEENDELYDILKKGETGRLKEEVQSLKRIVDKLEGALRESHQVIITLSTELDKSYQAFASTSARNASPQNHFNNHHNNNGVKPYPRSHSNSTGGGRLPPTGPRAHTHTHTHTYKKQRLSQADQDETSPSMRSNVSLPSGNGGRRGRSRSRSRSPRGKASVKMEVDELQESHQQQQQQQQQPRRSPERNRERWDRDRERGDRDRGRDRDRDGNRSRRSGGGGGGRGGSRRGGGGGGDRASHSLYNASSNFAVDQGNSGGSNGADRSLAERMGLS